MAGKDKPMSDEALKLAMVKARVAFLRKPETMFLSTVCFMLKMRYDETIGTGATNGTDLIIAPTFFLKLTPGQRVTLLGHETFHVILEHCLIMKNFPNKKKFNYAADYVINCFLVEAGFEPIPGWLYDPKYKGMSTADVYGQLPDDPDALDAMAPGCGPVDEHLPAGGTTADGEAMSEQEVKQEIVNTINTAAAVAQAGNQAGSIPSQVQVFLDALKKPKLPLAHHLRKFFTQLAKVDYSWRKPNRRFFPTLIPGLAGFKLTEIAFAYDMSGSVSKQDTTRYQSELVGVMKFLKPDSIRLVQFDTEIKSDDKVPNLTALANVKLIGRGGTDIEPLMEWAKKNKPTALVVFTDGEYYPPSFNPGCPVLWVIHGRRKEQFRCDFGTIIRFDTHE
jgi:predicted metal-dependent peptidase